VSIINGNGGGDFLDKQAQEDLFGGRNTDIYGGYSPNKNNVTESIKQSISKKLLPDVSMLSQLNGQFSIIKNYGGEDRAALWSITNPHKPKGQDFYVYTMTVRKCI